MNRRLFFAAISLLVGATLNIFVATACVISCPMYVVRLPSDQAPTILDAYSPSQLRRTIALSFGAEYSTAQVRFKDGFEWDICDLRAGWPLRTMHGALTIHHTSAYGGIWGWPTCRGQWAQYQDRLVPSSLLLPGFLFNTLFYATILWLLICGPFVLRRLRRIKRGLCPKCGYRAGESPVCTECGKALPQRTKVAT